MALPTPQWHAISSRISIEAYARSSHNGSQKNLRYVRLHRRRAFVPRRQRQDQREPFDQSRSESGRRLAWNLIGKTEFHDAWHPAWATIDLKVSEDLFTRIVDDEPSHLYR